LSTGQDEAEVDGVPEAAAVVTKRFPDGRLVAPEGPITLADSVELAPPSIGQPFLRWAM
jgi:hypothetical protein